MSQANFLKQTRQSFGEFWTARAAHERKILAAGAGVILLTLVYSLLIDPAWNGRKQLNRELPGLRQQVAQLQSMSREAAALSEKSAHALPPIIESDIEAALARNGLKPQSVTLAGGITQVKLAAAPFSATMAWIEEMQKSALLSVAEANIVALSRPDMIDATLTLRQPRQE